MANYKPDSAIRPTPAFSSKTEITMRKARAISAELDPSVRRQNILQVKGCGETAFNYRPCDFSIAVAEQEQGLRPLAAPALPGRRHSPSISWKGPFSD
jgi:hypothetical protein